MIKLMHIIHGLNIGGAETITKEYALNIDKKKFDLTIFCFENHNSPYDKILKDNNIKVIYVCDYQKYYNKKGLFYKVFNCIQRYYLIKKTIHLVNPDIIHTHLLVNDYVKHAKPPKGTVIFHTVHSEPKALFNLKRKGRKKDYKAAQYLVKKYGMRFICLHNNMRKEINKMFNVSNSLVLNNGIDFSKYRNIKNKQTIRKELNIPKNAYVIGHVGRFSKVKNHKFLVEIFNEIYIKNNKSFLLMIGSGQEKKKIEKKIKNLKLQNNYLILEDRTDIPDLLNAMDVFVFPSVYEGMGIALIEAQKAKLPCFISNRIPNSAIVSNLVTKLSLKKLPIEWANQIEEYSIPNKVVVKDEEFDMNKIVDRLETIYDETLRSKHQ